MADKEFKGGEHLGNWSIVNVQSQALAEPTTADQNQPQKTPQVLLEWSTRPSPRQLPDMEGENTQAISASGSYHSVGDGDENDRIWLLAVVQCVALGFLGKK